MVTGKASTSKASPNSHTGLSTLVHFGRIVRKNGQARHGGPCVHGQHVLPHRLTRTGPGKVARALSWDHVLDAEEIQSVATKIKNLQKDS